MIDDPSLLAEHDRFSAALMAALIELQPGLTELELYEFRYALDNLTPVDGWASIELEDPRVIESRISTREYFKSIQLKPVRDGHIVLDERIVRLTQQLFAGLVCGVYSVEWIRRLFFFDVRGFIFFVRTQYFSQEIREHFGGRPVLQFEPCQAVLEACQDIGYREFRQANQAVDEAFIDVLQRLIEAQGSPVLLTLVGPSGAGKTEIVERVRAVLAAQGKRSTAIEMDNFYKDGSFRDGMPLDQKVVHFELFRQSMAAILRGQAVSIPRYDFRLTTSSHDLDSHIKPGHAPIDIQPADIIFLEGNFPFHIPEIADLIGLKIVYLTDDSIRLKRKWRRDMDYRKKYDPVYFCNRYFRTQFLRAGEVYLPLMEVADLVVDTTAAALWMTPELAAVLGFNLETTQGTLPR